MSDLTNLAKLIEAKSRGKTLQFEPDEFRRQLGFDMKAMQESGFDPSTVELHEKFYSRLESYAKHPLIGYYLTNLTPTQSYKTSGVWIATLQQIRDCSFGEGSPESDLFAHGYISIAGDGSGNSISFHFPSGRVVFAHHEQISNILAGKVHLLSEDIATFMHELIQDKLTELLESLS